MPNLRTKTIEAPERWLVYKFHNCNTILQIFPKKNYFKAKFRYFQQSNQKKHVVKKFHKFIKVFFILIYSFTEYSEMDAWFWSFFQTSHLVKLSSCALVD